MTPKQYSAASASVWHLAGAGAAAVAVTVAGAIAVAVAGAVAAQLDDLGEYP